jgi:hypothetical protein
MTIFELLRHLVDATETDPRAGSPSSSAAIRDRRDAMACPQDLPRPLGSERSSGAVRHAQSARSPGFRHRERNQRPPRSRICLVVFGLGYGLDLVAALDWTKGREIRYWDDIDTHDLAMLDRLCGDFPSAHLLLLERETLLLHRAFWVAQPTQTSRLFGGSILRSRLCLSTRPARQAVRLEQERIALGPRTLRSSSPRCLSDPPGGASGPW